jgi:hypothetical protein
LNEHETYACSLKDVKGVFGKEDEDVSIWFGMYRDFRFDSLDKKARNKRYGYRFRFRITIPWRRSANTATLLEDVISFAFTLRLS